jgi:5-methylcytosine-specific restriction enzyme A
MGIWKDKKRGDWRYAFKYKGQVFAGGGHSKKSEARAAREARKVIVKPEIDQLGLPKMVNSLALFKAKYQTFYSSPTYTVPQIFDMVMKDIGLPVRFRDAKEAVSKIQRVKIPSTLRMAIFDKYNRKCAWCGRTAQEVTLQIDHIVPVSKGGITEERNLQVLCSDCNLGKNDQHYHVKI